MAANQPTLFNNAHNFNAIDCTFTVNGRTETFDEGKVKSFEAVPKLIVIYRLVLVKLKDATALGINYDSIDHTQNPAVNLDQRLVSIISSPNSGNDLLYFFHSIWSSDVRAYGEMAAELCKNQHVLHANIFVERLLSSLPGQGKKRLVPTLAYQLAASPYAPQELKIAILRALFLRPDIPQHNLGTQFERLIVDPLRSVSNSLPKPVIFVLDSVHTIHCDGATNVITELANILIRLRHEGVVAKAVITGLGYRSIINIFRNHHISRILPIPPHQPIFIPLDGENLLYSSCG